jgi:O-antigen ligase
VNVSFVASAIGIILFRVGGVGDFDVTYGDPSVVVYAIPNLMNATIILMLSWCEIVYRCRTQKALFALLLLTLGAVLMTPSNTQTVLVSIAIIGLSIVPLPRLGLAAAYAGLLVAFILAVSLAPGSITSDPNTWIRMAFWQDALSAINQSLWVGVGFGKEAVVNLYPSLRKTHYMVEQSSLVGQSIHNSFLYVFYRMGLLGGLAFLYVVFVEFFPKSLRDEKSVRLMLIAHFICVLCLFVNVGLESPYFVVGVCWALGFIMGTQDASSVKGRGVRIAA